METAGLRPEADGQPDGAGVRVPFKTLVWRIGRWAPVAAAGVLTAATVASFAYNAATDTPPPRPAGLLMASGDGFDTRYLTWGTTGTPIVLVPGAVETADTFVKLGQVLGKTHRVYAIDLTGTGYSAPSPDYSTARLAAQLLAFLKAMGLTGADAPVLVGHSMGASVVGLAAVQGGAGAVRKVVFLDGDALPFAGGSGLLGYLLIDPYRTSLLRLALSQDWLIKSVYNSNCGPLCPPLDAAGAQQWREPLQQPAFGDFMSYELKHGIPAMTPEEFAALKALPVPKHVIYGVDDPQMSAEDMRQTAERIGAPPPSPVPGRHLTMISSPEEVAALLNEP